MSTENEALSPFGQLPRGPAQDEHEAEADHRVDEREEHEVDEGRHERAHDLTAEDERAERGQDHEQRQLDAADAVGQLAEAPAAHEVGEAEPGDEEGEPAEPGGQVRPQRPVAVERAEQLADEHEREQRHRAREDVLAGAPPLDQVRQPGVAEAPLIGLELLVHPKRFRLSGSPSCGWRTLRR